MTKRTATWFVGGMLAALLLSLLAWPVIANPSVRSQRKETSLTFTGSSPLVIPAAAFRSDGYDPDAIFFTFSGGYVRGEHHNSCLMAPVYLPQFATADIIYASAYDNDSNSGVNLWINLYRVHNYTGAVDLMARVETTSNTDGIQILSDPSIDYNSISYPTYSYYIGTCLESADTRLYSVRIYYTEQLIFLPLVLR